SFLGYYSLARETSLRLMRKETGERLTASLESMRVKYNEIKEKLESAQKQNRNSMAAAIILTRDNFQASLIVIGVITIFCVFLMGGLSIWIVRGVIKPLGAVSDGFARMSVGDFTKKIEIVNSDEI